MGKQVRPSSTIVVDGTNLFIRMFAAMPTMNTKGMHIGGLYGTLRFLFSMIEKFNADECIIVFDGNNSTQQRRALLPEYKSGRRNKDRLNRTNVVVNFNEEEAASWQLQRLSEYFEILPFKVIISNYSEADDIIGFLIQDAIDLNDTQVVIISSDKDFLQLTENPNIIVYRPMEDVVYNCEQVLRRYGIRCDNYVLARAIAGDSSDNIKGVSRIGLKTILKLFPEFAERHLTIDELFQLSKKRSKENSNVKGYSKINDAKEIISRNYKLMKLGKIELSGPYKLEILEQVNHSAPSFNLLKFNSMLIQDGIVEHFKYFNKWISIINNFSLRKKMMQL